MRLVACLTLCLIPMANAAQMAPQTSSDSQAYCVNGDADFYPYTGEPCKSGYQLGLGNCRTSDGRMVAVPREECLAQAGQGRITPPPFEISPRAAPRGASPLRTDRSRAPLAVERGAAEHRLDDQRNAVSVVASVPAEHAHAGRHRAGEHHSGAAIGELHPLQGREGVAPAFRDRHRRPVRAVRVLALAAAFLPLIAPDHLLR
jgi:hypothetical protein